MDDGKNGVWLTPDAHGTAKGAQNIHTQKYLKYVERIILLALNKTEPCLEVDNELTKIRRELENYDSARNNPDLKVRRADQRKFDLTRKPTRDNLEWQK